MSSRTKTPISMRLASDVKAEAERRATEERRSFTSYVEWLIMKDAESHKALRSQPEDSGAQKP